MLPEPADAAGTLACRQQALIAAVISGAAELAPVADCPARPPAAGAPSEPDFTSGAPVFAGTPAQVARGLAVYHQAYFARLREALADNYGVFARALGGARFAALADRYALAHPPGGTSVRAHGAQLEAFLVELAGTPDGAQLLPHPALLDLARMDLALRDAFDAADCVPVTAGDLQALAPADWPTLVLQLLPSARRIRLEWAVESAWHLLNDAEPGAEPELPEPQAHPHALLVWRPGAENRWRSVDAQEDALLARLASGCSLGALAEALAAGPVDAGEAGSRLVGYLQQWLADGCLRAVPGSA